MDKHKLQAIINEVKETLPRDKWASAIKIRVNMAKDRFPKPEPRAVEIDDYTRAIAERLCEDHFFSKNRKVLLSQFIRSKSQLKSFRVNVKTGEISKSFEKGVILGALVAFKTDTEVKVGWSFYNKNHEVVPFTKRDAIRIAIIRGLTDGINYKQTVSKVQIPISISQALPEFILRATKYYSVAPANVQIGGTV